MRLPVTPIAAYLLVMCWASMPFVPAEPLLVAAGSYAAAGAVHVVAVIAASAVGSLVSDVVKYALGRAAGPRLLSRLARRETGARALAWIEGRMRRVGPMVIVPSYFVPFAVVASTLLCGALRMRLAPIVVASTLGSVLWSSVFTLLGFAGGAVTHNPVTGALLALPVAIVLAMLLSRTASPRPSG